MEKDSEDIVSQEKELEDEKLLTKAIRIGSLFQIMFYSIHNDYHRTPVFIMNAVEVYEKCKTLELVISFNESGICLCYSTMKSNCSGLAKYEVVSALEYTEAKDLNFQESFNVDKEVFLSEKNIQDHEQNEFIISCVWPQNLDSDVLSTWAGMRSLLSKEPLSLLQERYLPFIPHPVTEY